MNTQYHDSIKTTPYEVVFGVKPSSEPVSALTVIEDDEDAGGEGDSSDNEDSSGNEHKNHDDISEGT